MSRYNKKIGVFPLVMITVAYASSPDIFPSIAEYGLSCITLFALTLLVFIIPMVLVSSELASAWPNRGGVYAWVREALPRPFGFISIWFQFLDIIISSPSFLIFVAGTFAYSIDPALANDKYYLMVFVLVSFWLMTFLSFFSMKAAGWMNTIGNTCGLIFPLVLITAGAIIWLLKGNPSNINFTVGALVPRVHSFGGLVFLAAILYSFTGLETSASHSPDLINPRKDFTRAMFISGFILFILGFSAVSIAVIVPDKSLSLGAGIIQAIDILFKNLHILYLVPVVALIISFGAMISLNSTLIGPSKGLYGTSENGELPTFLAKENKYGMPVYIFIFQAIVVSIICVIFVLMPNANACYWIITSVAAASYLVMYVLMFVSVIILRYKQPDKFRPFRIPGGKIGVWITGGIGALTSLFGIIVSFYPPSNIQIGSVWLYELTLLCGVLLLAGLGIVLYLFNGSRFNRVVAPADKVLIYEEVNLLDKDMQLS